MISLFASSVRPQFYDTFFGSLQSNQKEYEVIFAGPLTPAQVPYYPNFKYIHTGNIKPAQCYEIARRACSGSLIHWTADDAVYSPGCLDKVTDYFHSKQDDKLIISIQTIENGNYLDMREHTFFGRANLKTPLMAPLGVMLRRYMPGIDRRYVCGQWDNHIVMGLYQQGFHVEIWEGGTITLDHYKRHGRYERPFSQGFPKDREVLEYSWATEGKQVRSCLNGSEEPFDDQDILTKSQSNNLPLWV